MHQGKDDVVFEDHHYPFAGKQNPKVKLAIVRLGGGDVTATEALWLDICALEDSVDIYLARVDWMVDGSLVVQVENREQSKLDLLRFDLKSSAPSIPQLLLREESRVWINLHRLFFSFIAKASEKTGDGADMETVKFLWGSERSGFMQLYLYQMDASGQASIIRQVTTEENFIAESIIAVVPEDGLCIVQGTGPDVERIERHAYAVRLDTESPAVRLTSRTGFHAMTSSKNCKFIADSFSSVDSPPEVKLLKFDPKMLQMPGEDSGHLLFRESLPSGLADLIRIPELGSFTGPSGDKIHCAVYKPPASFGPGPHPLIVEVYGGPHVQRVTNSFNVTVGSMRRQYLSQQGFVVAICDNRGSSRRGLAFEGHIKHCMGTVEVDDQVAFVQWLASRKIADPTRVGVYGWSYGGYMSLMLLSRAPAVFHAAVSGAPVTHWDGYGKSYLSPSLLFSLFHSLATHAHNTTGVELTDPTFTHLTFMERRYTLY